MSRTIHIKLHVFSIFPLNLKFGLLARLTFPLILTQSFSSLVCLLSVVVEDVALQVELTEVAAEAQEEINKAVSDSQDEVV